MSKAVVLRLDVREATVRSQRRHLVGSVFAHMAVSANAPVHTQIGLVVSKTAVAPTTNAHRHIDVAFCRLWGVPLRFLICGFLCPESVLRIPFGMSFLVHPHAILVELSAPRFHKVQGANYGYEQRLVASSDCV